jgi:hypothetical protein
VHDGYQRDSSGRHRLVRRRRSLQRLELALCGAVENIPTTGPQLFADRIGRLKVAIAPALDAFSQKLFGL